MKNKLLLLVTLLVVCITLPAAITSSYYSSIDNKSGSTLFSALTSLSTSKKTTTLSKDALWTAYQSTDLNSSGKIWDIYSTCTFTYSNSQCGNYSNVCDCYNREHTVPQDWLGSSDYSNEQAKDLMHIFPTDGKVNGGRSSFPLGETAASNALSKNSSYGSKALGALGSSSLSSYSGTVYEPDDQYKGDLARVYMYMRMHYATKNIGQGNGSAHFSTTTNAANATNFGLTNYSVELLLKWHREDPVSQKEIDRNNAVEAKQGNRNPFVDYPCLAEYLWGEHKGETFKLSNAVGSFETSFTPGTSTGCSNSGSSTTTYTVTWNNSGSTSSTTVTSGNKPTLPTAPTCTGKVFRGWTQNSSISSTSAPSDLFSTSSDAPTISANTVFYAVFATASTSGGGTSGGTDNLACPAGTVSNSSITYTTDHFTILHEKGTGSATPASYSPWRIYGGNTVTISGTTTISSISIVHSGTYYATLTSSAGTVTMATTSGGTTTITGINSTSVVITNSATSQSRWASIAITYGSSSGSGTTYSNYTLTCGSTTTKTNPTITFNNPTTSLIVGGSATSVVTTNSNGAITYSSSNTNVAEVNTSTGKVTANAAGTAIITATVAETSTYYSASTTYTLTVQSSGSGTNPSTEDGDYVKVTENLTDWSGDYVIVYEAGNIILNGGGESSVVTGTSNYVPVTISNNTISAEQGDPYRVTIAPVTGGYSIRTYSGLYITGFLKNGAAASGNALNASTSTAYVNTILCDGDSVNIYDDAANYLRYNSTSGQTRFRYFKNSTYFSQKKIHLYKKEDITTKYARPISEDNLVHFTQGNMLYLNGLEQDARVTIFDCSGRTISSRKCNVNEQFTLNRGIYILHIQTLSGHQTIKIVI